MKTYNVIYAQNVSVYGDWSFEAENDEEALLIAKNIDRCREEASQDIAWDCPEQERIVALTDEDDNYVDEDVYLTELDRPKCHKAIHNHK